MKKKSIYMSASGTILPAILFIILIPKLIQDFGLERFGFISLFWAILSVASIFDMGVSRALTYYTAKNKNHLDTRKLELIWDVFYISMFWGVFIAIISFYLLKIYFENSIGSDALLKQELLKSALYIALSIPLVIAHATLRGVLEGLEKFNLTSFAKIFTAILAISLLFFNKYFEADMAFVAVALLVSRLSGLLILYAFVINDIRHVFSMRFMETREIFVFSGWASLSNFSSSIMIYLDRFIAGYFLTPLAYGSYTVIADVVMRFLFIPGAISAVLYPHISKSNKKKGKSAQEKATFYVLITIFPICLSLGFFGEKILTSWLNTELINIDVRKTIIIFSMGLFINALAHIPYASLQGSGKVKLTARLHIVELIIFTPLLFFSTIAWGINGLLSIWLLRIFFDYFWLSFLNFKYV